MNLLMLRYILEIEKDPSLYKKFLNGSWYPNFDKYRMFLHKLEKNNHSFAKTIQRYHLVRSNDHLIETVFSKDLDTVATYLEKEATLIQSGYGTIHYHENHDNFCYPSCYISNGIFHDTKDIVLEMARGGSFAVGVCDNPNSVFYQENIEKMEELKKLLHKKHIPYKTCKHNNHRDKTLILHYRSDTL